MLISYFAGTREFPPRTRYREKHHEWPNWIVVELPLPCASDRSSAGKRGDCCKAAGELGGILLLGIGGRQSSPPSAEGPKIMRDVGTDWVRSTGSDRICRCWKTSPKSRSRPWATTPTSRGLRHRAAPSLGR